MKPWVVGDRLRVKKAKKEISDHLAVGYEVVVVEVTHLSKRGRHWFLVEAVRGRVTEKHEFPPCKRRVSVPGHWLERIP